MTTNANDLPLLLTIAVLGGTGKEGSGLAMRWALNGYRVIIGSRDGNRAMERAGEMNTQLGVDYLIGKENAAAAAEANLVVLSRALRRARSDAGKREGAASGQNSGGHHRAATAAGHSHRLCAAGQFRCARSAGDGRRGRARGLRVSQRVSFTKLKKLDRQIDSDVLICGDDADAKADVMHLVEAAGMRGIDAGSAGEFGRRRDRWRRCCSTSTKPMASKGAGIRITGI